MLSLNMHALFLFEHEGPRARTHVLLRACGHSWPKVGGGPGAECIPCRVAPELRRSCLPKKGASPPPPPSDPQAFAPNTQ